MLLCSIEICHHRSLPHSVPKYILSSSLSYSYLLVTIHYYSHQTKRLLTPKVLRAYTTPSLSALSYSLVSSTPFHCFTNSIIYLIQSCKLQTSQRIHFLIFTFIIQSSSNLLSCVPCAHYITQCLQVNLQLPSPINW